MHFLIVFLLFVFVTCFSSYCSSLSIGVLYAADASRYFEGTPVDRPNIENVMVVYLCIYTYTHIPFLIVFSLFFPCV